MKRQAQLLILTHLYAIFAIWHLCWAKSSILVIVLSHVIPSLILSLVLMSIVFNKFVRFTVLEQFAIMFLITLATFYHAYIALCGFSTPEWIWYNNVKSGIFIAITIIFYSITLYKLKREYK